VQIGKWHTGVDTGHGRDWDHQIVWNRPGKPDNAGAYYEGQIVTVNGKDMALDGYSTDQYTQWAVDYIKGDNRAADKPWYLWLCYGAVHGPTTPAKRHKGHYAGQPVDVPADIFGPRPDKPAYLQKTQAWKPDPDGNPVKGKSGKAKKNKNNFDDDKPGKSLAAWVQQGNECVMAIDEGVGKILAALKDSGQLDNTLIVYTTDQGFAHGEHGLDSKIAAYDAAIASPLIVSMPARYPQGKVCDQPVNSADLVATILAHTEMPSPWPMHGHDLTPLLKDAKAGWDHPMLMIHTGDHYGADTHPITTDYEVLTHSGQVPWWVMLRQGSFKYIRTLLAGEMEELYDLSTDPEELHNLARQGPHSDRVLAMRAEMVRQLKLTNSPFAEAMPPPMALPE
jgi:arylsulfatase A-like enzyme